MKTRILLTSLFCLMCTTLTFGQQQNTGRYIEVTGSSEIEIEPDEIHYIIEIREYWEEEFINKAKPEDYRTKVPLSKIEESLRKSLANAGIRESAIRTQEIGEHWRERGKDFLIGKQFDITLDSFDKIDEIISHISTRGINAMRIGELKNKNIADYRQKGKIEALKAAREKAIYLVEAMGEELGEVIHIIEPAASNINPFINAQVQSNMVMGGTAGTEYRVVKLRYEMTARFAIK